MLRKPTPAAHKVQQAPRIRLCRTAGSAPRGSAAKPLRGWAYFLQNEAVNNTRIENSSSRPSSMVIEQTQVWKSDKPW